MSDRSSQCMRILRYMETHGSITSMEAFEKLGITRLSGRIKDLKDQGYRISSTRRGEVPNYSTYFLEGEEEDGLD